MHLLRKTVAAPAGTWAAPVAEETRAQAEDIEAAFGKSRRRMTLVVVLTVLGLATLFACGWLVRTEAVGGPLVDRWIVARAASRGLVIRRGEIEPVGLTGVGIHDLRLYRPGEQTPWVEVSSTTLFPDLVAALSGKAAVRALLVDGVEANLRLGKGDSEDLGLLREMARTHFASGAPAVAGARQRSDPPAVPTVRLRNARLAVTDVEGRVPPVEIRCDVLEVNTEQVQHSTHLTIQGEVDVAHYGHGRVEGGALLPEGTATVGVILDERADVSRVVRALLPAELDVSPEVRTGGVMLSVPAAVSLRDVSIGGLQRRLPWEVGAADKPLVRTVRGVDADSLTFAVSEGSFGLEAKHATLRLDDAASPDSLHLGHLRVDYDRIEGVVKARSRLEEDGANTGDVEVVWRPRWQHFWVDAKLHGAEIGPWAHLVPAATSRHVVVSAGRATGKLVADVPMDHGTIDVQADMEFDELSLEAPVVAERPLEGFYAAAKGHLRFERDAGRLTVSGGRFRLGEFEVALAGQLDYDTDEGQQFRLAFDLETPRLDGQRVFASLPPHLVPALEGYRFEGEFDLAFSLKVDSANPDALETSGHIDVDDLRVVHFGPHADLSLLRSDDFTLEPSGLTERRTIGPGTPQWVADADIPEVLPQAIVSAEDGKFWKHPGFDPAGIRAALVANIRERALVRGGSTVTQQVIKNLYLNHNRTASRKIQEAVLTWAIEHAVPKDRIMAIYINMLHWGPHIYGLKEASRLLFDKRAPRVSLREAVFLASVLPNPNFFTKEYALDRIPDDRRVKMRHILANMASSGFISKHTYRRNIRLTDDGIVTIGHPPRRLAELCGVDIPDRL